MRHTTGGAQRGAAAMLEIQSFHGTENDVPAGKAVTEAGCTVHCSSSAPSSSPSAAPHQSPAAARNTTTLPSDSSAANLCTLPRGYEDF